ncbi:hypothetical protein F5X99DRAFT_172376 [Biscogniauxia marginata]|nr:hypothetical protein F5X99DRAFT_172376 [Biscogniauxia marginata]
MDSGTYNNVRRGTNPIPTATPSATSYKANVNRTKTRKWVEAKMQSYDGDDWGNEFDDDDQYDEPEEPPPPRTTGRGQLGQISRAFSQPAVTAPVAAPVAVPNTAASSSFQSRNGPPSLHVQTQPITSAADPRFSQDQASKPAGAYPGRPEYQPVVSPASQSISSPEPQSSGLLASRFPPRQSSMGQQGSLDTGNAVARRLVSPPSSSSNALPSVEQRSAPPRQPDGTPANSLPFARPADIYRRMDAEKEGRTYIGSGGRPSFDNNVGGGKGTQPTVRLDDAQQLRPTESRHIPTALEADPEKRSGTVNDGRLSVSPQLPDLARLSGFGDDFFSISPGYSTQASPGLASIADHEPLETGGAGAADAQPEERIQPSSTIEGPKLQPNPDIIMPPANDKPSKPAAAPRQPTARPQIPGGWVSETASTSAASGQMTPVQGIGATSLAAVGTESDVSPTKTNEPEPADIEPTTQVKQLPSSSSDQSLAMARIQNNFDRPTGQHDDAVASEVIAAGPGHHPTPRSLPPLKTDNPSNNTRLTAPIHYSPANQPTTTSSSEFTPTAPLNPHRSSVAAGSSSNERKQTFSTVGTGSPQKESDKLREEIIKSLGSSALDAHAVLNESANGKEPIPGDLSRESTYLSDVYDDYLLAAEEKSLQETGDELKKGYMMSANQSAGASNTGHPPVAEIAPLSPQRGPKSESPDRPRRFSWEQGLEQVALSPIVESKSPIPSILPASHAADTNEISSPKADAGQATIDALQAQPAGDGTISQRVSQVSSRGPDDVGGVPIDPPSPISIVANRSPNIADAGSRTSQLSLAEEKEVLIAHASSSSPEQHPALARESESPVAPSSGIAHDATAQTSSLSKILTFREILNIASTEHRIQTFEETRNQFSAMETGLSNWIMHMQSQIEPGGAATASGESPAGLLSQSQQSPTGTTQRPAQQPYYQQYLNASNPNGTASNLGRTPSGNLQHMLSGQPASGFGASGNQVGTKSKELLHAAGAFGNKGVKSGMKLFNKGRNKLRERTNEKQFF